MPELQSSDKPGDVSPLRFVAASRSTCILHVREDIETTPPVEDLGENNITGYSTTSRLFWDSRGCVRVASMAKRSAYSTRALRSINVLACVGSVLLILRL